MLERRVKPKYSRLMNDLDIRNWYHNIVRGSRITADFIR